MSTRQKIEDALKATPNITLSELQIQLLDIKPATLKTEFYRIKRKLSGPITKKKPKKERKIKIGTARQKVSEHMNKNPKTTFKTLKATFPDINLNTLSNYLSTWKKEQKKEPTNGFKPAKKTQKVSKKKQPKKVEPVKTTRSDKTELIESLKKTVAAQEKTIQTISKALDLSNPEIDEEELQGMTLSEIKRIAVTFLKSIRELPSKLKK
jgi:uncharacterized coiled-coil protein SlyX